MIFRAIYRSLFRPRCLPSWWVRLTDNYSIIPTLIAVVGLAWITIALSHFKETKASHNSGAVVATFGTVSQSPALTNQVAHIRQIYRTWFPQEAREIVSYLYYNPALYLIIPFILLLEFLFPVNASQPLIGKGFVQDAIWFVAFAPIKILILFPIGRFLEGIFNAHSEYLTVAGAAAWPEWARLVVALLISEFLIWFNHFVRHKTHVLWVFHAVHHSQREINVFTDDRQHVIDAFLESFLTFVPFFVFKLPNYYAIAVIGIYLPIHNRFIHSNIKMNLSWLGLLIVSPQFHRVHHSAAPEHLDKNFGAHISLFDYLFGTGCRSRTVYPQTGITDFQFPSEDNLTWWQLPGNWLKQIIYPFAQLAEERKASLGRQTFAETAPVRVTSDEPH